MITFDEVSKRNVAGERFMAVFRPNIQRLVASGNVGGLINAAVYNDPDVRRNAIAALGRIKDRQVYKPLIEALQDDFQSVRIEAIIALGRIRDPSFVNSLQWSLNDPDPIVRMNAIWALGQIPGRDVIKPLILSMADSDKKVRIKAVETVASKGDAAVPELRKAIKGRNQLIRQNVINVLGKLKRGDLVQDIIHALDDPIITVRENAIWALGVIGDPIAIPSLEKIDTPRARKSLKHIKEGPHWKTVAENYEKAGRYEDAAVLYETKSEWEEAGRLRNKAKEPINSHSIPQILANSLNLSQETIIRDSIISRSRIGKGSRANGSVIHRSNVKDGDLEDTLVKRSEVFPDDESIDDNGKRGDPDDHHDGESLVLEDGTSEESNGDGSESGIPSDAPTRTADGYKICPFCGLELTFDRAPNFCPYCAERL